MKMGQLASFIDTDYLPDEYRELYQEKLARCAPRPLRCRGRRCGRCSTRSTTSPTRSCSSASSRRPFAAASIGQVHRGVLHDGREVAVKIQYPGIDAAIRADLSNAGMILRLTKALAPGLDAKAVAAELRERVLEELDYEHEAQNQRSFARAYRGHPFICVPDVVTRLSREQGARHRVVEGMGFEQVKQLEPGGAQPLRGDRVPLLPRLDLPAEPLQRGRAPGQLRAARERQGGVPRLRDDEASRPRADPPRGGGREGAARPRPGASAREAARAGLPAQPEAHRRGAADGARRRGRRLVPRPGRGAARSLPST